MLLKGTRHSTTGEKGWRWRSLFKWLYQTQTKTISEQLDCYVTLFDLHIDKTNHGWCCVYGLWQSHRTAEDILYQINEYASKQPWKYKVSLTFVGKTKNYVEYFDNVMRWTHEFPNIEFVNLQNMNIDYCNNKQGQNNYTFNHLHYTLVNFV